MKTAPENQAYDVLRILRLTNDATKALQLTKSSRLQSKEMFEHDESHMLPWQLGLPFELMTKNPVVYRPIWHLVFDSPNSTLGGGKEARNDKEGGTSTSSSTLNESTKESTKDIILNNSRPSKDSAPNPDLCDDRLHQLDISQWTSLPISNTLAAHIISLYLQTDHPILATFDPDLFIDDLVSGRAQFCSKFLVHTVMYWGCQMYSTLDSQASSFIASFGRESKQLWMAEKEHDSHLNLASIQLLGMSYIGDGKDHYVLRFVAEAQTMATRMGLIGIHPTISTGMALELPEDVKSATSYAAWGTFNWIILMSLFYQQPGLSYTEHAPTIPVPRFLESSRKDGDNVSPRPSRRYMGDTFTALCQFWKILHEVSLRYYRDNPPPREQLSEDKHLLFAEYKLRELLAWSETLPESMMQAKDSPHHVIIFYAWFHAAILDILRPFTVKARGSHKLLRLKTFSAKRSSVDAAFRASVSQLKWLVITFRSRYACSAYTMLWHTALIYVANATLQSGDEKKKKDPAWHFYLLFCIHCYETLRQSYRFAEATGRGLLAMTLQSGDMSANEAREMMEQLQEKGVGKSDNNIRATFMVDLILGMANPEQATVESLADQFEDVALFQEFINENIQEEGYEMESEDT